MAIQIVFLPLSCLQVWVFLVSKRNSILYWHLFFTHWDPFVILRKRSLNHQSRPIIIVFIRIYRLSQFSTQASGESVQVASMLHLVRVWLHIIFHEAILWTEVINALLSLLVDWLVARNRLSNNTIRSLHPQLFVKLLLMRFLKFNVRESV